MSEQSPALARCDSPTSTDVRLPTLDRRTSPGRARKGKALAPDPVMLTIGGVLLFVVLVIVIVVRTLYPAMP